MTAGIYTIKNKLNEKIYIGRTINYEDRRKGHLYLLRQGKHGNHSLQKDFDNYGESAFEIELIDTVEAFNLSLLKFMEAGYLDLYRMDCITYNIRDPLLEHNDSLDNFSSFWAYLKKNSMYEDELDKREILKYIHEDLSKMSKIVKGTNMYYVEKEVHQMLNKIPKKIILNCNFGQLLADIFHDYGMFYIHASAYYLYLRKVGVIHRGNNHILGDFNKLTSCIINEAKEHKRRQFK